MDDVGSQWDVFISHASEDKSTVVRQLFEALTELGVSVWFDEAELTVGDSLSRSIDSGLANSNFGILVVSKNFLSKKWPEYEYRGLVAKEMATGKTILPVWHEVDHEEVLKYSPTLADKYALSTSELGANELARSILRAVNPNVHNNLVRRMEFERRIRLADKKSIAVRDLKIAPVLHGKIPHDLAAQMKLAWLVVREAYPSSFDEWVDGFRREAHPAKELFVWQRIASAFVETKAVLPDWNPEIADEVLAICLASSFEADVEDVKVTSKHLTDKQADEVIQRFFSPFPLEQIEILNRNTVSEKGKEYRDKLPSVADLSIELPERAVAAAVRGRDKSEKK